MLTLVEELTVALTAAGTPGLSLSGTVGAPLKNIQLADAVSKPTMRLSTLIASVNSTAPLPSTSAA